MGYVMNDDVTNDIMQFSDFEIFNSEDDAKRWRSIYDSHSHQSAGALVSFEGKVRNHNQGKKVEQLYYEAYVEMAQKEGLKVIEEAKLKFSIIDIKSYHRIGQLNIGDIAVKIVVISAHRADAFDTCRFIIDELKQRVPIWKKERYDGGDSQWVRGNTNS